MVFAQGVLLWTSMVVLRGHHQQPRGTGLNPLWCSSNEDDSEGGVCSRSSDEIAFLVEGLSVHVPQSLLDRFPDTKLAKLAALEERHNQENDPTVINGVSSSNKPIPIDVDLIHFRYLVNLLRQEPVLLPYKSRVTHKSLSKVLKDFGFPDMTVRTTSSKGQNGWFARMRNFWRPEDQKLTAVVSVPTAIHYLDGLEAEQRLWISEMMIEKEQNPKEARNIEFKVGRLRVALFLFQEYRRTGQLRIVCPKKSTDPEIYGLVRAIMVDHRLVQDEDKTFHQESLVVFGLRYHQISCNLGTEDFIIDLVRSEP